MSGWSRRYALRTVASAGLLALAGCSDATSSSPDDSHETRDRITDFEPLLVRNHDGEPLFVHEETGPEDQSGGQGESDDRPRRVSEMELLTGGDDLEGFRFRDVPGAAELRSFVTATDLESKSVYLLQRSIGECYVSRLVGVYREGNGVDTEFCQKLRPADAECSVDANDVFAVAIRLPFSGDDFNSIGSGSGGDCDHESTVALPRPEGTENGGDRT